MPEITFLWFSKDEGHRVLGIAAGLKRIAEDHNLIFHVRTEEQDPDPETEEGQDEPPDPVRLAEGLTLPKDVLDQLRQMAKAPRLHIIVTSPV
jgi:hypothetical protein